MKIMVRALRDSTRDAALAERGGPLREIQRPKSRSGDSGDRHREPGAARQAQRDRAPHAGGKPGAAAPPPAPREVASAPGSDYARQPAPRRAGEDAGPRNERLQATVIDAPSRDAPAKPDAAAAPRKRQNSARSGSRADRAPLAERRGVNTTSFDPVATHRPADLRVVVAPPVPRFPRPYVGRDVVIGTDFFCAESDGSVYESLLNEIKSAGGGAVGVVGGGGRRGGHGCGHAWIWHL